MAAEIEAQLIALKSSRPDMSTKQYETVSWTVRYLCRLGFYELAQVVTALIAPAARKFAPSVAIQYQD